MDEGHGCPMVHNKPEQPRTRPKPLEHMRRVLGGIGMEIWGLQPQLHSPNEAGEIETGAKIGTYL